MRGEWVSSLRTFLSVAILGGILSERSLSPPHPPTPMGLSPWTLLWFSLWGLPYMRWCIALHYVAAGTTISPLLDHNSRFRFARYSLPLARRPVSFPLASLATRFHSLAGLCPPHSASTRSPACVLPTRVARYSLHSLAGLRPPHPASARTGLRGAGLSPQGVQHHPHRPQAGKRPPLRPRCLRDAHAAALFRQEDQPR